LAHSSSTLTLDNFSFIAAANFASKPLTLGFQPAIDSVIPIYKPWIKYGAKERVNSEGEWIPNAALNADNISPVKLLPATMASQFSLFNASPSPTFKPATKYSPIACNSGSELEKASYAAEINS